MLGFHGLSRYILVAWHNMAALASCGLELEQGRMPSSAFLTREIHKSVFLIQVRAIFFIYWKNGLLEIRVIHVLIDIWIDIFKNIVMARFLRVIDENQQEK